MVRTPVRVAVFLSVVGLFALATVSAEQEPANAPTIKVSVNSVLVPVVVRDSHDRAVGDLTQSDFHLFDKGKPLQLTGFTVERRAPSENGSLDATSPAAAGALASAQGPPSQRFVVFLFDDLHMSQADLAPLRKAATRILDETLRAGDSASVLSVFGNEDSGVTTSRDRLASAIADIQAIHSPYTLDPHACPHIDLLHGYQIEVMHDQRMFQAAFDETITCAPLDPLTQKQLAETLTHAAAQRAVALGEEDVRFSYIYLRELVRKMVNLPGERTVIFISPGFFNEMPEALVLQSQVIEAAARANVTISALDARGLYTTAPTADDELLGKQQETTERIRSRVESLISTEGVMESLSDATGGTFVHNSNDLDGGLRRLSGAPEYVYLLEFSLDNTKPDGRYHPLKVNVERDHVHVQSRRGYFAPRSEKLKKMMADSDATAPAPPVTPKLIAPRQSPVPQTAEAVPTSESPPRKMSQAAATTTATEGMPPPANPPAVSADSANSDSGADAAAAAEAEATGIPVPTNTSPSPSVHEPAVTHAAATPAKTKVLYWNPPDLDPGKQDRLDATECALNEVLAQAATRATELVSNLQNFTAQEHIVYRVLGGGAEQIDSGIGDFDYNAVMVRHTEGFKVQETRVAEQGGRPFPAASKNIGLPEMALIFLPEFQGNYEMHCGGAVLWQGQAAWLVTVRQRKDRPDHTATFSAANGDVFPAPLKGRAWIAQDSGEVLHLEIGLMHPVMPVGVMGWFLSIDYAPVKFRTRNVEVWLPSFAETYDDADYRRTIISHEFSKFMLFSVETRSETSSPASR